MNSFRVAWRNIWRNGRRTGITAAAVCLSTAVLVLTFGLMRGMKVDTMHNITHLVIGDAQIHAPGYLEDRSFYKAVVKADALLEIADKAGIKAAPRSFGYGLVSVGTKSAGARYWGVDPAREKVAFDLPKKIMKGRFLSEKVEGRSYMGRPVRELVLGRKLARTLHAEVGTEIVAVVQAADGSLGNELFVVTGILKTVGEEIDRSAAIIHKVDFAELFVSGGRIQEIALNARDSMSPEQVVATMGGLEQGAEAELDVKTWRELSPSLADMMSMWDAGMWIFALIFLLAAGLGVMNTMLMATYERIREFGMLKALGTTPWRILKDVTIEAFTLGLFSCLLGAGLGVLGIAYLAASPIDLSAAGGDLFLEGVAFEPMWRAAFTAKGVIQPVLVTLLVCVLASLYPAVKAARLNPVRAMQHV